MKKTIKIKSEDNTDILMFVDKIQCVAERNKGCMIVLGYGRTITTSTPFETIENAILEALKEGETE